MAPALATHLAGAQVAIQPLAAPVIAEDPAGWEEVDVLEGQAVETRRRYHASGRLRRIFTQLKGRLGPTGHHGRDLGLHETGAWSREAFWSGGKLNGPYKEWSEGGQLLVSTSYSAGKRDGLYLEYGEMGALRVQAQYRAGVLDGELKLWFGPGEPQEISHWENGIQVGLTRIWSYGNTPISEDEYANGLKHGQGIVYHRIPGEEHVHQTGLYKNGEKEGVWVEFNPEGEKVQEKFFVAGQVTGFYREFRGGQMTLETHYVKNVEQGARRESYASGKRFSRGELRKGARKGVWLYWNEDGSVHGGWSGFYADGKKVRDLTAEELAQGDTQSE